MCPPKVSLSILLLAGACQGSALDLSRAVVVSQQKAAVMLVEEVEKRTQIRWPVAQARPSASVPVIEVRLGGAGQPEGYRIRVAGGAVSVVGNDARGVLFGVGRLLRALRMSKGAISIADDFSVTTAPKYPLRGHQLGYRPKTNSYDGWTVPMWEQYIRDLAVFGRNAIELIPPRSDDAADSPHFPLPPMEMMVEMSRLADEYGLDVWIWYPAMDRDYSDPKTVESALDEWGEVFKKLPRIDAVFVPGGDPGHTQPKYLMALLEKQTAEPAPLPSQGADVGFAAGLQPGVDGRVPRHPQDGATGVAERHRVRAAGARELCRSCASAVPKRYPIRHYPDITHSRQCQYPVPDWDPAYALTEAREVHQPAAGGAGRASSALLQPYTIGFLTYSEGCNDDVNKIVWSALGWDPEADVVERPARVQPLLHRRALRRRFRPGPAGAGAKLAGPLLANAGVYTTLAAIPGHGAKPASPQDLLNWRFQQALYRAYYDAYIRSRLIDETALEEQAMEQLRAAPQTGSLAAMARGRSHPGPRRRRSGAASDWRARVFELAEALYQSIRMQLSVARYKAIAVGRGANLDTIDMPLNNRLWLKQTLRGASQAGRRAGPAEGHRRYSELDQSRPRRFL